MIALVVNYLNLIDILSAPVNELVSNTFGEGIDSMHYECGAMDVS